MSAGGIYLDVSWISQQLEHKRPKAPVPKYRMFTAYVNASVNNYVCKHQIS